MSAAQRPEYDRDLLTALGPPFGGGGAAAGSPSAMTAGVVDLFGGSPLWGGVDLMDILPDLSAGQVGLARESVASMANLGAVAAVSAVPQVPQFQPPKGFSARQMADFMRDNLGRRPSSLASSLGLADPASTFWLETLAHLQRSIGRDLTDEFQSCMQRDPSGRAAFDRGVDLLSALARRPLDAEDGDG